jgi:hypothetical protein
MRNPLCALAALVVAASSAAAQHDYPAPLISESTVAALNNELSGSAAKRTVEFIAQLNRPRGSKTFNIASDHIAAELARYGLEGVTVIEIPTDGRTMYGTEKSRPAWDPQFAELWEVRRDGAKTIDVTRIASFEDEPVVLAEDSDSGSVTAELIDVGDGTNESDYAGKDVKGKLVLIAAQPGAAAPLAVDKFGAAGMVSYAQNQPTAWSGEDENLIRWGHLDSYSPRKTFSFMLSLKQARAMRARLTAGEHVTLRATVYAARHPGTYRVVTAIIKGADPALQNEEIVYSCHLDHQRPGANDNASGCATILEVARTLDKLVREGRIARPARTLRFIWPAEIEATMALFHYRADMRAHFKAAVQMDMVGGNQNTKAIFHVTRGPPSLPSFAYDVGEAFGAYINNESDGYASGTGGQYPFVSVEGGKEALLANLAEFTMGSDNIVYAEGSFRIPVIYLNDWPDRYIHTNFDTPANIDATKLQRAAFIGAASGLYLANVRSAGVAALWNVMKGQALRRAAVTMDRRSTLTPVEASVLVRAQLSIERAAFASIASFAPIPDSVTTDANQFFTRLEAMLGPLAAVPSATGDGALVFARTPQATGPMSLFVGYDYFADHYKGPRPRLIDYQGLRGAGGEYIYETLNLVNGKRNARDIRDLVSAEYGPVPLDVIVEYLKALQAAGVLRPAGKE